MKKTAIITFHNSYNCGSMLQALALQKKLEAETNTEVSIIDFSNEGQSELYSIFERVKSVKSIVKNALFLPVYKNLVKQTGDYIKFMEYFNLTDKHYTHNSELCELDGKYDYFVCGSDQVWNIRCPDADDAYYLNFVKNGKKIAYAPSFGGADLAKVAPNPEIYKDYINDLDYLSIRESNGKRWIKNLTGRDAALLLDPTLLLSKEEWLKYAHKDRIVKEDYIFYYAFHYSKEQNKIVKQIAKKLGLKVVSMDPKMYMLHGVFAYGVKLSPEYGPQAFLNLISNASMVLTRSFHGVAFSTIFEKKFWMLGKIVNSEGDDRAYSILNQLDLTERMISLEEIKAGADISKPIDYPKIKANLKNLQEKSIEFIKDAFSE